MDNRQWENMYDIAKQYYKENGNLLISSKYVTAENKKLGYWIGRQRKEYKANKLSKEKVLLLEKIGMVWSIYDADWYENYALAKQYYENVGDLLIPLLYTTNNGKNLGAWIGKQRKQYKEGKLSNDKTKLLEKIGMVWSVYDIQWREYYDLASEYYRENGNLLVPLRYKTTDDKKLGSWISSQRISYKSGKLSNDRIEMLEQIGMAWDGMSATWDLMYEIARQYYEENHNLSISSTTFTYQNASLGSWVVTQRKNYSEGRLTDKQITMLNKIGMEWVYTNNPDYVWEKNYNTVLDFYSRYKHLYIPIGFVTEDGVRLGVWLHDRKYEYEHNELSEERRKKLDELDKTWREAINTKSSFPEQAVLFYIKKEFPSATKYSSKELSEIDIYIPELRIGIEYDGPSHANRVKNDIEKCKRCKKEGIKLIRIRDSILPAINDESYKIILGDNSFEALDEGIIELLKHLNVNSRISVDVKRDYIEIADNYIKTIDLDWYMMYERLKEYKKEYGHINIPIYYKTPDGILLGHWLSNIRSSYKNPTFGNTRLNSNKIKLLEELGIDWAPIESQWEKIYLLAKQYYEENGNLLIPDTFVTAENIKLGRWIGTQRYNFKEGIISEEKIALLDKIGMIWSVYEYDWMRMYDQAVQYYRENGNLLVPNNYKTKNNISLGSWIGKQRKDYRENKISDKEVNLLNQIGMVWSLSDYEWMKNYRLATDYYNRNGNLVMPKDYKTKEGVSLGRWIERQRKLFQDKKLSGKEVDLLNSVGMEWSKIDYKWLEKYDLAVSYYKNTGNLLVPSRYTTVDGVNLGLWIKHQRKRYKENSISEREKSLLDEIGMVWNLHQ